METATPETGTVDVVDSFERLLTTETPEEVKEEAEPTEEAQAEPVEESTDEPIGDPVEEVSEEAEPETEEQELSNFDELANYLEVEPDYLDSLKVKIKVQGEESEVNLSELRNGYQREADYSRKTAELGKQREELNSERDALQSERQRHTEQLEQVGWYLRSQLESVDHSELERMRQEDPAEYAAQMEDLRQTQERFQGFQNQYYGMKQQEQAEFQGQIQEVAQVERGRLLEKMPEWSDPDRYAAESKSVSTYLAKEGFSEQEISSAIDHRLIVMARKASLYDEMQSKAPAVKKVVKKTPKMTKPGTTKTKKEVQAEVRAKKRAKARKSGNIDDLADVFIDFIGDD